MCVCADVGVRLVILSQSKAQANSPPLLRTIIIVEKRLRDGSSKHHSLLTPSTHTLDSSSMTTSLRGELPFKRRAAVFCFCVAGDWASRAQADLVEAPLLQLLLLLQHSDWTSSRKPHHQAAWHAVNCSIQTTLLHVVTAAMHSLPTQPNLKKNKLIPPLPPPPPPPLLLHPSAGKSPVLTKQALATHNG